ncbi:MAG: serine hydrolase domain-containing protein [Bacteroidota bacterium]
MMKINLLSIFILVLAICSCDPEGWQYPEGVREDILAFEENLTSSVQFKGDPVEKYTLGERMEKYNVPGISIAVVKDGKIYWALGYGIANTETGAYVDENTLFQAGSISKPIAALAALKLVQEGKMDLDENINSYLSSWKLTENEFTAQQPVTLRGLLTHSAGVSVHGFPGYSQEDDFPTDIQVLNGKGNTDPILVDTTPRTFFRYSGGGYTIMERAVEDVSGQSFTNYLAENVLEPLQMDRSTYQQPIDKNSWENISAAYRGDGSLYEGWWHNYPEQAAAGLWTTPTDLAKYILAMQANIQKDEANVLNKSTTEMMFTQDKFGYGLGPGMNHAGDSLMFGHGGKNAGFTNNLQAWVHRGDGLVVMTSADQGGALIREVERAIGEVYGWSINQPRELEALEVPEDYLEQFLGKYTWPEASLDVVLVIKKGILHVDVPSQGGSYPLRFIDSLETVDLIDFDRISFQKDESGKVVSVTQNGRYRFDRVPE